MTTMLSVSDLSTLQYCKRKLFLQKVFGLKEPMKVSTSLGTLHHSLLELCQEKEEEIVKKSKIEMQKSDLFEIYMKSYSQLIEPILSKNIEIINKLNLDIEQVKLDLKKTIKFEADFMSSRLYRYIKLLNIEGEELYKQMPKLVCEVKVKSELLGLNGRIDRLEETNSNITIYEIKTGKPPIEGFWPGHKTQICAYILMAKENFGKESKGFVYYLENGQLKELIFNPFLLQELKKLLTHAKLIVSSRQLPDFIENKNKCTNCGLKEKCYDKLAMDGMLSQLNAQKTLLEPL